MKLTLSWRETGTEAPLEITSALPISIGRDLKCTVVLDGDRVSRRHAEIVEEDGAAFLIDPGSTNGTLVNDDRIDRHRLAAGDRIRIGDFELTVRFPESEDAQRDGQVGEPEYAATVVDAEEPVPLELKGTLVFQDGDSDLTPFLSEAVPAPAGLFPPPDFAEDRVSVAALKKKFDLDETTYLALGGGLGSFVWVDHLLIFGADPREVMTIGLEKVPYARYARLCGNSQIPLHERLRSNSDSCPDNIWGWPGYAVREIWGSL
jgi:pSer/pThr/pTyr-binding forkhead associated (FHA) protein